MTGYQMFAIAYFSMIAFLLCVFVTLVVQFFRGGAKR